MSDLNFLALLVLVPVIGYVVARHRWPARLFTISGAAFGAIVSPLAIGLYSFYFLSPWGVVPGFLGLALALVHGEPGFRVAIYAGLIPPEVVTEIQPNLTLALIDGLVWAPIYAFVGFAIDWIRSRRRNLR